MDKAGGAMEALGVVRRSWKDNRDRERPCDMSLPIGLGVIGGYSEREGVDKWGWGASDLSTTQICGVNTRDGDLGYFFSVMPGTCATPLE
jgi:hypothetical protein